MKFILLVLIPIIVAVIIGTVTHFWLWGILSFPVAMLIVNWIAVALFGRPDQKELKRITDRPVSKDFSKEELSLEARQIASRLGIQSTNQFDDKKRLGEAYKHLWQKQDYILRGDDQGVKEECLEIIRLCQLCIQTNREDGDAYVLLADALIGCALLVRNEANLDVYEFLMGCGAAVISLWDSFPDSKYSSAEGNRLGERLLRVTIAELMFDREQTEEEVIGFMTMAKGRELSAIVTSPESFENILTKMDASGLAVNPLDKKRVQFKLIERLAGVYPNKASELLISSYQKASGISGEKMPIDQWWMTFLKDWGGNCLAMWETMCKIESIKDRKEMQRIWLTEFEPLWSVGCEYMVIMQRTGREKAFEEIIARSPRDPSDLEKLQKWSQNIDAPWLQLIDKAKNILRKTITDSLKKNGLYDNAGQ